MSRYTKTTLNPTAQGTALSKSAASSYASVSLISASSPSTAGFVATKLVMANRLPKRGSCPRTVVNATDPKMRGTFWLAKRHLSERPQEAKLCLANVRSRRLAPSKKSSVQPRLHLKVTSVNQNAQPGQRNGVPRLCTTRANLQSQMVRRHSISFLGARHQREPQRPVASLRNKGSLHARWRSQVV